MILIFALACWLGWIVHGVKVQRETVAAIRQAGGRVQYDSDFDVGNGPTRRVFAPLWLLHLLGIDYFASIKDVRFNKPGADKVATLLARLPKLTTVEFSQSDLSDTGLARLRGLNLHRLMLIETKVTDAGLRHVHAMTNLEVLFLDSTSVGDNGMEELSALPMLEFLTVSNTKVSDLGVRSIAKLPALKILNVAGTQVGDAGAARLKLLSGLKALWVHGSRVTAPMIKQLYPTMPGPIISPTPARSSEGITSPPP